MKKTLVKWSCLAIGVLASCQQRDLSEGISSDFLALNLQASVAGEIISRTTTQQDGHTTFVQGDKIGFFMPEGDDAILWTLGESVWQPDTPLFGRTRRMIMIFVPFIHMQKELSVLMCLCRI